MRQNQKRTLLPYETEIISLGKMCQEVQHRSDNLVSQYISNTTPIEDDLFWKIVGFHTESIQSSNKTFKTLKDIDAGTHNLFCRVSKLNLTFWDLVGYVKTYNQKFSEIHNTDEIWKKIGEHSDDGWFDFCDFLPMMGRETWELVKNLKFTGKEKFFQEHHECYVMSTLRKNIRLRLWKEIDDVDNRDHETLPVDEVAELRQKNQELELKLATMKKLLNDAVSV